MRQSNTCHTRKYKPDEYDEKYDESLQFHMREERRKYKKDSRLEWKFKFYLHEEEKVMW